MSFVLAKLFAPERPGVNVQGCSMSMMSQVREPYRSEQTFNLVSNLVSLRLLSLLLLGSRQLLGGRSAAPQELGYRVIATFSVSLMNLMKVVTASSVFSPLCTLIILRPPYCFFSTSTSDVNASVMWYFRSCNVPALMMSVLLRKRRWSTAGTVKLL